MTPLQEAPHLLALFRQLDSTGRMGLVQRMREQALRRLAGHIPQGFDAANSGNCIVVAMAIEASAAPTAVKAAARLLRACVHAVEAPSMLDAATLVGIYAALDAHAVERDAATQRGRRKGGNAGKKAKLPPADKLHAMVLEKINSSGRSLSYAEAKGVVRQRFGATSQAINKKLKNLKPA